ncbi:MULTISPECIES: hypothetical protein [unclassified Bradyrhizobium]|uniref:DUF4376 domain-containing protein n=1 Tax=unclassified Bradyrhizobium TaxID=2631580 RepID=UPI00291673D9|nr:MULTISPECIES: hypothetical protein [unclassified Bradyrhizobium]
MKRYAIVDTVSMKLITVVESEAELPHPIPGFSEGVISIQHDTAGGDWIWDGEALSAPPVPPPTIEQLIGHANSVQWSKATGGYVTTINGEQVAFPTSPESLSLINGKHARLQQANPPASVLWQAGATSFITIAAADFERIAVEVADFVQVTFEELQPVIEKILSGEISTLAQIDSAFA